MPATPAWPPASTPRLFVGDALAEGAHVVLDGAQAHYLATVMRARPGDPVRLCDDLTGEWLAEVTDAGRRRVALRVAAHLRDREAVPDLWLCFAGLKKGRIDWLVEKATELGVARLQPVVTARTIAVDPNLDRLRAHAIEAAEQCDRASLPTIAEPVRLAALLRDWDGARALHFGPEGGFTDEERALIRAHPAAVAVGLGPRILRAETAALAAVALWMAAAGDW